MIEPEDSNKIYPPSIRVSNTKFCLVINKMKIGTQYIRTFNNYEGKEGDPDTEVYVTLHNGKWEIDISEKKGQSAIDDSDGLDLFLNGKTIKDTIVLIRNPFQRFVSAFNQDFIKPLFETQNIDYLYFLGMSIFKESSEDIYKWWVDNKQAISKFNQHHLGTNTEELTNVEAGALKELFKNIFAMWKDSKISLDYKHNGFYHSTIVNMLFNNQNKYKIFDIDKTDLNDVFGKYCVGNINFGKPNEAKFTKKILLDILAKDKELSEYINKNLASEIASYNTLLSFSNKTNN